MDEIGNLKKRLHSTTAISCHRHLKNLGEYVRILAIIIVVCALIIPNTLKKICWGYCSLTLSRIPTSMFTVPSF